MSDLRILEAGPLGGCLFCGYSGQHYYQEGTHASACPWFSIGGLHERSRQLPNIIRGLYNERRALRALLIECREAYRRPWDYGFAAVTATDQRVFAAWLARLDAALGGDPR